MEECNGTKFWNPSISLPDILTRASSPGEQHPAKVQWSAGQVRKRLYALLSQGWWERGSKGKTNKHWLIPIFKLWDEGFGAGISPTIYFRWITVTGHPLFSKKMAPKYCKSFTFINYGHEWEVCMHLRVLFKTSISSIILNCWYKHYWKGKMSQAHP